MRRQDWCEVCSADMPEQRTITAYDRALALNPNDAKAWNNKGVILNELTLYDEALAALDRAIAIDPNHAKAWRNKSFSLLALHRTAEAEQAKQRAKEHSG